MFNIIKTIIVNVSNFFACAMFKISKSLNICKNYLSAKKQTNILIFINGFFL